MEAVKKYWFWGIFISILSIFAMSHNANAIDFSLNLDNYNLHRNIDRHNIVLRWNNDTTTCQDVSYCEVFDSSSVSRVKYFKNSTPYNIPNNSIVVWRVLVGSQLHDGYSNGITLFGQKNFTTKNDNFIFLGYNQTTVDSNDVYTTLLVSPDNTYESNVVSTYHNFTVFEYYFKVLTGGNYYIGFETSNYNSINADIFDLNAYDNSKIMFKGLSLQVWQPTESKENKEVEEKTQEAVDESETAGGDSSTSAQTGTTGLLNAITGAVSVISSAQPTNCKINGNMGNLDIGQLDLCANPAPAFVQTIGSLILILMCVPLAISLFNRFIAIFRSFQS